MVEDHAAALRQALAKVNGGSPLADDSNPSATGARDWREAASALVTVTNSIDRPQLENPAAIEPKLFTIAHLIKLVEAQVDQEIAVDSRLTRVDGETPRH
jgi:hypothetical protein